MSRIHRLLPVLLAAAVTAQTPADLPKLRADARMAYQNWRDGDPNLEGEAKDQPKDWEARVRRAGEFADRVAQARLAVARAALAAAKDTLDGIDRDSSQPDLAVRMAADKVEDAQLSREAALLSRSIQVFAADKDAGIQQVKAAMDREQAALTALQAALAAEQKTLTAIAPSASPSESARPVAAARCAELFAGARQEVAILEREAVLWKNYYAELPEAARIRLSERMGGASGERAVKGSTPAPGGETAGGPVVPRTVPPEASRWVGRWVYPAANGMYYGDQPEFVDLAVDEQNGRLMGSLTARFKIPAGVPRDPNLRFDFSGPLTGARSQKLAGIGPAGEKGTLELLPGPATNLLEVNWQFPAPSQPDGPQKVLQGNVILIRK